MTSKAVLITGAAKGIGKAIAIKFANEGYNVCINYNTSEDEAINLKKELINAGLSAEIFKADVSKREEVDLMIDQILKKYSSVDVVINNAGISEFKLFTDITHDDFINMFNITLLGTFNVTQSALKKYMINKKEGSIVNISSVWGVTGASFETNYSTMKAGIIGMTKSLAKELGLSNIRVNAIAPGMIDTDMNKDLNEEEIKSFIDELPLQRIGRVEEVAETV